MSDVTASEALAELLAEWLSIPAKLKDHTRLLEAIMSNQAQQDLDVQQLVAATQELGTSTDAILSEIATLQAQGVDVSGLNNAVSGFQSAVSRVTQITQPAAGAPPVDPNAPPPVEPQPAPPTDPNAPPADPGTPTPVDPTVPVTPDQPPVDPGAPTDPNAPQPQQI